jgi:hypothetical protein
MALKRKATKKSTTKKRTTAPAVKDPSETPVGVAGTAIDTEPEDTASKATGAIGPYSREIQDHTGPVDALAERTIRSIQRYTNTTLPKGPWILYRGREDTAFVGVTRKACRVPGLFVCVAADGTEETCIDGYVVFDEPSRHPSPVPAVAFANHFEVATQKPKN